MDSESEVLMKEYSKMMTDMMVLCATLALSLFCWIVSLTISAYSGEQSAILALAVVLLALIAILRGEAQFPLLSRAFLFSVQKNVVNRGRVRRAERKKICGPVS